MTYTAKISRVSNATADTNKPPCEGATHQYADGWWYWEIEFDDIGELIDRIDEELIIAKHTEDSIGNPQLDFVIRIHDNYIY